MTNTNGAEAPASGPRHDTSQVGAESVSDIMDLGAGGEAPPTYGEAMDHVNFSHSGFNAGAAVTGDGRVNININQVNTKFASILAPALRSQLMPSEKEEKIAQLPPAYIPPSLGGQPGQTPPPNLNVVIQIVGSRGDVQPFVALGKVLKDTYGHRIRVATHPVFQSFVEDQGLEFFSIGGDPAELMAFMVKNPGLMPGMDAMKSGEITKRRKGTEEMILGTWRSCIEAGNGLGPAPEPHAWNAPVDESFQLPGNPSGKPFVADAIIANPPSFGHIHIAEKMGIPLHMMFTMPWSPTKAFPHPLANIQSSNTDDALTNFITYILVEMLTWQGLGDVINRFRTKVLNLEPLSLIWAPCLLSRMRIPYTYCWSPALIPKPNDWGKDVSISGFFFLDLATSYTPEPDLAEFLAAGPPPVYIGFGSIVVDDPNKLTRMIFDAISISGVRALVSKGWGGLGADSVGIPDGVFMLGNVPHDWLFTKVSCVVHHGGAGTTAAGIKAGTPTVVVPFFGDQPFWGAMINRAGAGPAPVPYKEMTAEKLAECITSALKPETKARAKELGEKIRSEQGSDLGGKAFHDHLDMDSLRCLVAPSRVAVWRIRKTQTRLSALAAAVLVDRGLIRYSDIKPYRSIEYKTEEQPWEPITAVTAALVADITDMGMAVTDWPRNIFKGSKQHSQSSKTGTGSSEMDSAGPSGTNEGAVASTTSVTSEAPATETITSVDDAESADKQSLVSSTLASPTGRPGQGQTRSTSQAIAAGAGNASLATAISTGKLVGRMTEIGMKSPMNFTLGLAKGFRNAPKLYNDDTVRPIEKVTGIGSGLKVAGKEFGLGLYDGITGLVTQPLRGAEKGGYEGLAKGIAKGFAGIVFKPAAGMWALPAYTMQGINAEIRTLFKRSVKNYIFTSRVMQGKDDLANSTPQEQQDIVRRFEQLKFDEEKGGLGKSASKSNVDVSDAATNDDPDVPDEEPKVGWSYTKGMSLEERKQRHAEHDAWKKRQAERQARQKQQAKMGKAASRFKPSEPREVSVPATTDASPLPAEMEAAIQKSVAQTSTGNRDDDARVEAQIRASVMQMRQSMAQGQDNTNGQQGAGRSIAAASGSHEILPQQQRVGEGLSEKQQMQLQHPDNINDEEYQSLVEEAVRQSLMEEAVERQSLARTQGQYSGQPDHGAIAQPAQNEDDEALRKAIEESKQSHTTSGHDGDLRRAMEESQRAHEEHLAKEASSKTEEETVLEYIKKQSLAEEEFRRQQAKGKMPAGDGADDDDEDLKRAMEESLRSSGRGGGEGSGQGGASSAA